MCKYCERITRDEDGKRVKLPVMSCTVKPVSFGKLDEGKSFETMAQVIDPTPISMRKHQEDGLMAELQVLMTTDKTDVIASVPIRYCPFCGKDLCT